MGICIKPPRRRVPATGKPAGCSYFNAPGTARNGRASTMAMLPTLLVSCQTRGELSWNTIAVISKLDCDARRPELTVRAKKLKAAREVTSSTTSNRTRDKGGADITLAYN